MAQRIDTRIERLEAELGIAAEDVEFLASLNDSDAMFYRRIMRQPGSRNFEQFIRTLPDEDLRRLHEIHGGGG